MLLEELHITAEQLKEGFVVPVDKPRQWSSFQVVNKLKWQIKHELDIKKFKIGHAGTLDPLASGLLLVCLGPATKRIPILQDSEKYYTGTMVLGATTACYDLERAVDTFYPVAQITENLLEATRQQFLGPQQQVPPMFSAVKVNGKRAYIAARSQAAQQKHQAVDHVAQQAIGLLEEDTVIKEKSVTIHQFDITAFRPGCNVWQSSSLGIPGFTTGQTSATHSHTPTPNTQLYRAPLGIVPDWLPQIDFVVRCTKGTYIRSLARDFGFALGSGAFLSALRRTQVGDYNIESAYTL